MLPRNSSWALVGGQTEREREGERGRERERGREGETPSELNRTRNRDRETRPLLRAEIMPK